MLEHVKTAENQEPQGCLWVGLLLEEPKEPQKSEPMCFMCSFAAVKKADLTRFSRPAESALPIVGLKKRRQKLAEAKVYQQLSFLNVLAPCLESSPPTAKVATSNSQGV